MGPGLCHTPPKLGQDNLFGDPGDTPSCLSLNEIHGTGGPLPQKKVKEENKPETGITASTQASPKAKGTGQICKVSP